MGDGYSATVQQMALEIEAVKGAVETLTNADVKFKVFGDISHTLDHPRFTNEEIGEDEAAAPDFVGGSKAGLSFGINFRSSGVVAGPHAIAKYLRSCGMREYSVNAITIGAISGGDTLFLAGETYSAAAGAKTGTIDETISSPGVLKYTILTGGALAAADVVTSGGDSATASGTNAVNAIKYAPRSLGKESATIQRAEGNSEGTAAQDSLLRLRGAMGTFTVDAAALDIFKARFDYTGILQYAGAGSRFTGITYEAGADANLPKLQNATLQLNSVNIKPDAFSFALNAQVEMDPDVTTDGGADGYVSARISGREATITLSPLRQLFSVLDDWALLKSGAVVPFHMIAGVSPWQIEFRAPRVQYRAATPGTRAGMATNQLTLVCVRGTLPDDDFAWYFR